MKQLALLLACFLASTAHGGAVFKTSERNLATGKEESLTTLSAADKRLRVERVETGKTQPDTAAVFKDGGMLVIDHRNKTYMQLDKAAMQKMAGAADQAMKQLQERMAGMSEEQRAMIEKMMGKNAPGAAKPKPSPLELRNTGRKETVGAYTCRLWEATRDGQVQWQHCVVDFSRIEGSKELLEVMQALSAMMDDLSSSSGWIKNALGNSGWEGLQKLDGYPVLTRMFRDGKPVAEMELKSARTAAIDAASFEPPPGYKRKDIGLR